ncbi:MAG: diguanylate cyclase [Bryobacteraceae bacterium]|nr:diguanylate cyclase [Bryobacteraceae bacterium]
MRLPIATRLFISAVSALGLVAAAAGFASFTPKDVVGFGIYLCLAACAAWVQSLLPRTAQVVPVSAVFAFVGILEFGLGETLLLALAGTWVATLRLKGDGPYHAHRLFHLAVVALATTAAFGVYRYPHGGLLTAMPGIRLAASATAYFFLNTWASAVLASVYDRRRIRRTWEEAYFWSFPHYLIVSTAANLLHNGYGKLGWDSALALLPPLVLIYRSHAMSMAKMATDRRHVEEMASLHLRTIEALAMAIEAKDECTHDHLRRVQVYAIEVGKELGLTEKELQALRAASILHDIGKLAVPDYILSKPGRLTPEEFEKMKIHPIVGAEIIERVGFDCPVAPIVRYHHERWDGLGYPFGLRGEDIPIGARVLAAVDCLDALATDRQYRPALPLAEAMRIVASESGKSYDPKIVEILERRYQELESMAQQARVAAVARLPREVSIVGGDAPANGFEETLMRFDSGADFLSSIAAARQEVQILHEITHDLSACLRLEDSLSAVSARLKRLVPFDTLALFVRDGDALAARFAQGEEAGTIGQLRIPFGAGISGWVAANRKPIINGIPGVEPGLGTKNGGATQLRSALSVPMHASGGLQGVITLYSTVRDAYNRDHLRILLAIQSRVSVAMENAFNYQQAQNKAALDGLTGLPNASSMFLHLDAEIARCRRGEHTLSLLVCDLDGFKQVNDTLGHLEGNRLLKEIASLLRSRARPDDFTARMGGDEFVLVLPDIPLEVMQKRIQEIEEAVSSLGRNSFSAGYLGASIGYATFPNDGSDAEALLAEADRRMYEIKKDRKQARQHGSLAALRSMTMAGAGQAHSAKQGGGNL